MRADDCSQGEQPIQHSTATPSAPASSFLRRHRRLLIDILKYALGIGLLVAVVASHWQRTSPDGREIGLSAALTRPFNYTSFLLALSICLTGVVLTFVRWYVLVRAQGLPFTLLDAIRLGSIGFFFSTFLPGSIGGDIVKAACLVREQNRRAVAVSTVLLDRALGLCGLFWLVAVIGGILWINGDLARLGADSVLLAIVTAAWCGTLFSIVFWIALGVMSPARSERFAAQIERIPRVGHVVAEFWRAVRLYRNRTGSIALAMTLALAGHVGFVFVFYWSAATLTPLAELPGLDEHFVFVPVGEVIQAGFPTPNGIGGSEYAYGWIYSQLGSQFDFGLLGALVQRAVQWIIALIGAVVYLQMRPALKAQVAANGETAASASTAGAA